MRRKFLTQTRTELTAIGNLLAELSQAVLLLAEREAVGFTDQNYPKKSGKAIAKRMAHDKKVTGAEVAKYATETPVVVLSPTQKRQHRAPQCVTEIEGDYVDYKRDQTEDE